MDILPAKTAQPEASPHRALTRLATPGQIAHAPPTAHPPRWDRRPAGRQMDALPASLSLRDGYIFAGIFRIPHPTLP